MIDIKLKHCPFCGREATVRQSHFSYSLLVKCDFCEAQTKENYASTLAIKAWNTRTSPSDDVDMKDKAYEKFSSFQRKHDCPGFDCLICSEAFNAINFYHPEKKALDEDEV